MKIVRYVKSNSENYLWGLFYGHAITVLTLKTAHMHCTASMRERAHTESERIKNSNLKRPDSLDPVYAHTLYPSAATHTHSRTHTSFGWTNGKCVKKKLRVKIANLCYVIWILFDVSPSLVVFPLLFSHFRPLSVSRTRHTVPAKIITNKKFEEFDGNDDIDGGGVKIVTDCLSELKELLKEWKIQFVPHSMNS